MDTIGLLKRHIPALPAAEANTGIFYLSGVSVLLQNGNYGLVSFLNEIGINVLSKNYFGDADFLTLNKAELFTVNGYSVFSVDNMELYGSLCISDIIYGLYRGELDMNSSEIVSILREMDEEFFTKFGAESKLKLLLIGGASILLGYGGSRQTMELDFYEKYTSSRVSYLKNKFPIHFVDEDVLLLHPDAMNRLQRIGLEFKSFELFILSPVDLAVSKIRRLVERDLEDIQFLMENKFINREELFSVLSDLKGQYPGQNYDKLKEFLNERNIS